MDNKHIKPEISFSHKIKKRLDLILNKKKVVIISIFLGVFIAAISSFLLPKIYRATGKIVFKYNSANSSFLSKNGSLDNEINFLTSEKLLKSSVDYLAEQGTLVSLNDILESEELLEDVASAAIGISIVSNGANKSAEIANTVAEKFSEMCILNNKTNFISALRIISEREKSLQEDIRRTLVSQQATQITILSMQQEQLINQIAEFESELESIELDNYFYSLQFENLQKILDEKYPQISSNILGLNDLELSDLKVKLERLETKNNFSSVSQKFSNFQIDYPWEQIFELNDLSFVKNNFNNSLDKFIDDNVENRDINNIKFLKELSEKLFEKQIRVNSIDLTKSIIFNILIDLEGRFNLIPFSLIDIARQSRIKKFNTSLDLKIKSKKKRLQEREKEFFAEIESIRYAEVPKSYFSPTPTLNVILGSLIGFIIGILIAVSSGSSKIELVRSTEDLEDAGYKIIAHIPFFPSGTPLLVDSLNKLEKSKADPKILNSFINIETFLKYGSLDKPLKTILVTSGQDEEGKSIIASNIAIVLANSGNKVLLIDANLKHPRLDKYFKVKSTPSLAHYLFRKKELKEIIRKTYNSKLDIITCIEFPQNPAVIITSERMKNFMDQVKQNYDYIVYDSSSLCSLKETAALANNMDKVIMVVRANKTTITEIVTAESLLLENGIGEFSVVLNDVKS